MKEMELSDCVLRSVVDATPGFAYRRSIGGEQAVRTAGDGIEALVGADAAALDGDERGWLDVVHPDDRERLRATVADASPDRSVEITYRIRTDDGDVRRVRDRFVVDDADSAVVAGVVFDARESTDEQSSTSPRSASPREDAGSRDAASEPSLTDVREDTDEQDHRAPARSARRDAVGTSSDEPSLADPREDAQALLDAIFEDIPVHLYVKDEDAVHLRVSEYLDMSEPYVGKTDLEIDEVTEAHARRAYEDDLRVVENEESILDKEEFLPALDQWNLTSKVPWENEDGEVVGLIGVTRDITERKRAQEELRRKTERLEEFADVVAHDIRNPLNVARGHVDLAREAEDPDAHLAEIADSIDRANDIIDDVLALSRHGRGEIDPEPVSLAAIARGAWRSVTAPDATLAVPDEDVVIEADRSQLRRLLENLFANAVEHGSATPGSAERSGDGVTITVESIPDEADGRSSTARGPADGFAVVDDGTGIPEDRRDEIFEPSYTTSEDGTGFGLAIVREIADAHDWSVSLCERVDPNERDARGARFEITGVGRVDSSTGEQ